MHGKIAGSTFLWGGGEMGALIPAHDWSTSPLGPPETWPPPLRIALGMVLGTKVPTVIGWGPDLITIHNDAYRTLLGGRPEALGRPFLEVWSEARDTITPLIEQALAGEASYFLDAPFTLMQRGLPEQR